MIYRPRTPTVEARQWTGNNWSEMRDWLDYAYAGFDIVGNSLLLENRSGRVHAKVGDWIVHESDGFYPMEPVVFHAAYEALP